MTERNRGCDWEQLNRRYQLLTPIALRSFEGLSEESGSEGRSQGKVVGGLGIRLKVGHGVRKTEPKTSSWPSVCETAGADRNPMT